MSCEGSYSRPVARERLTELATAARQLPDVLGISSGSETVRVDFRESEFIASFHSDPVSAACRVSITAVVRAESPDLRTWWRDWTRTCPPSQSVQAALELIQTERTRFQLHLADRAPLESDAQIAG